MTTLLLSNFPVRPSPNPAESAFGFVGRVYAANGHRVGETEPAVFLYAAWLGYSAGLPEEIREAEENEISLPTLDLARFRFVRHVNKCCYQCMREIGYQLRTIDVEHSEVCPLHHVRLGSTCPACRRQITLSSISKQVCACGGRLDTDTASAKVDPVSAIWEAKVLEALSSPSLPDHFRPKLERCMPGWLKSLTLPEIERVLDEIRRLTHHDHWHRRPEKTVFSQWPIAFHATLRYAIQRKMKYKTPAIEQSHLLSLFPAIKRLACSEEIPSEVRRRVWDFLDVHALSTVVGSGTHVRWLVNPVTAPAEHLSKRFVHAQDLAAVLGWEVATVISLVRRLKLPATALADRGVLLEQHVAKAFVRNFFGLVPLREVALCLGISDLAFVQLLRRCRLSPHYVVAIPRHEVGAEIPEFLPAKAVARFRRMLFSRCHSAHSSTTADWLLISQLPFIDKPNREELVRPEWKGSWHLRTLIASALAAIIDGRLNAACSREPKGWRDIRVEPASAREVLNFSFTWKTFHANKTPAIA